jgi:hypothetical protein
VITAAVEDATSEPAAVSVTIVVDTATVGPHTVSVTGVDNAGRTAGDTCQYQVSRPAKIAFTSSLNGNFEVYSMNADGSHQARLTNNPAVDNSPDAPQSAR